MFPRWVGFTSETCYGRARIACRLQYTLSKLSHQFHFVIIEAAKDNIIN